MKTDLHANIVCLKTKHNHQFCRLTHFTKIEIIKTNQEKTATSVMVKCQMRKEKWKNKLISSIKITIAFIFSFQSLRLWKQVEMNDK